MKSSDNSQYWIDRHQKHLGRLVSVGDIRRSEDENLSLYAMKKRTVLVVLKLLGLGDLVGRSVLDVGCGIGLISELFYVLGGRVTGIDASNEAIESARYRCPSGRFQVSSVVDFSLPERFELVFCADVLYHVIDDANWNLTLKNLVGHLALGGWLVLIDQLREEPYSPAPHVRFRSYDMYRQATAGLNVIEVEVPGHEKILVYRKPFWTSG